MNVLLINPPLKTVNPLNGVYPMGLGYVAAVLKQHQCDVDLLDIRLNNNDENYVIDFLKKRSGKYQLIGIGSMVTAYRYSKWIAREAKKYNPSGLIIAGGSLCTAGELLLKNSDVDIVCIGEGERVIADIVEAVRSNKDFSDVPNIMIKMDGVVMSTKKEAPIDIDSIPFPAWDLFDMEQYTKNHFLFPVHKPSITMMTERGCPYECAFCYRNFGRKTRKRNVNNIINEIKTVIDRYGIGHIDFIDEIFNVNPSHVKELCKGIIREDIKISWRCIGRADLIDREVLKLMYEAGCRWIGYGIESGSQEMLNRMNKRQKIENIEKSIRLAREAGIIVTGTFIIGMPGETEQTIQESRNFYEKNKIFNMPFFPVPYPGAVLYDECNKGGLIGDEEAYVLSLEKDATELVINLTDMPDSRLVEIKKELVNEYGKFIPSMELRGSVYTVHSDPEVDKVVEKHLSHIVERLKLIPSVKSIILGGGFGRGEGSVLIDEKGIRPVNDYDIFVVVSDDDKTEYTAMSAIIAKEIGMRLLDIIPVTYSALPVLPATQFYYDLKYGSRHLWGEYVLDLIPEYIEGHVVPDAGRTLLMNRLICAIEAYSENFEHGEMTQEEKFFLVNQTGKVVSSCVESLLIKKRKYHYSYMKRQEIFEAEYPEKNALIELNRRATSFKLRPVESPDVEAAAYWNQAVHEYVKVIAEYIFSDSQSPVEDLMMLIRQDDARLTNNPVEHAELMLLLHREASLFDKEIILSETRRKLEALNVKSLQNASWEDMRDKTAKLWHKIHSDAERASGKDVVVLILIDGFRHDYINPVDSPFLYALAEQNIHGSVRETFAFELRPAFFAGLHPEECEVANMYCYDPDNSPFRSIDVRHGDRNRIMHDLRNEAAKRSYSLVKHIGSSAEIPLQLLKYFDFSEKYHTADPDSLKGHKTLFDYLRQEGKKWLWIGYPDGPGTTVDVLNEFLKRVTPDMDFIYLHFSELDWAGHEGGPHSYKQKRILREIDTAVRKVYSKLNQTFRDVRSVVFGDHGQVVIKKHIDLETMLKQTGLKLEEDYIYFLDSTQARFWFLNDAARTRVTELLSEIQDGTILTNDDYERLHFRFEDKKFGELIFVVNDGVGIFPNFFQNANPCKGLHGYLPEVEGNWAKLIIAGLGIERRLERPVEMVSIFPTLLELLRCENPSDINVKSVQEIADIQLLPAQYKASLVMPTYDRLEILEKCIHAIEDQTRAKEDFELIVVDDGSTDGTAEFLQEYKKNTKLNFKYFRQVNSGPAAARNTGIKNSHGEVIILVGDDMIMQPDFIENHLRFHEEWPQISHACLGFIDWPKDIEVDAFMKFITSSEGGQQFNYGYIENQDRDKLKWDGFWSSNVSFKRLFSLTHGLFNQQVFKYAMWEDIELGHRLGMAGLALHYRKECTVYHEHKINFEGFVERQRMVGWHYPELKKTGMPEEYMVQANKDRIYSRKALSVIVKLLSGPGIDIKQDALNNLYNYALKYATLAGSKEREKELREDVEGDIALLVNLSAAEQELAAKDSKLKEKEALINALDNKCGGYEKENQRLSGLMENIQSATPALGKILKRIYSETPSPEMLVEAGEVCFGFGSYDDAKGFFEKALLLQPANTDALNNIGVIELYKGNFDNARSYFLKVLSVAPDYQEARNNLNLLSEAVNAAI